MKMKKMPSVDYSGKKSFNTNSKTPTASKSNMPKGFVRGSQSHGVTAETMGVGGKPTGRGKAMGTMKGKGGKSY